MPAQTVIQIRRDTEANWLLADPTLAAGEIGFDSTNNKIKIGNGTTAWSVLPYASGAGGAVILDTAPADPELGQIWFNSSEGRSYVYYDATWVELNPSLTGPAGTDGVVEATTPLTYNSGTKTVGIDQSLIAINASQIATTVTDKAISYTLQASDENTYIRSTSTAITITVPDVLANGESVNFLQAGTGQITFAGSGVTINSKGGNLKTAAQYSAATITKLGGAYYLVGDLGA